MTESAGEDLVSTASDHPENRAFRAVLDTNVAIAAHLSRNSRSLTVKRLERWRACEFTQLNSTICLLSLLRSSRLALGLCTRRRRDPHRDV